jgi:hypothetical protein
MFIRWTRIQDHQLAVLAFKAFQLLRRDSGGLVAVLDEFAEGLRRHVDPAEELAAPGLPAGTAAIEHRHIGIAHRREPPGRLFRQILGAAV